MDYSSLGTYSGSTAALANDATMAAVAGIYSTMLIAMLVFYALVVVAQWKIFTKAGEAGWKSLIPIYNMVILFKISGLSPWLLLVYLLGFIPVIGTISALALNIVLYVKLSNAFGHGAGYAVGLFFLSPIFMLMLGFGSSEYVGEKASA